MNSLVNISTDFFSPGLFETRVKVFHELMSCKVREILLISTPYDAFIMEEDGSLTTKIINEYKGLNLSHPPRLTKIYSGEQALELLKHKHFDLVITMPNLEDVDTYRLVVQIKSMKPKLPVILMAHNPAYIDDSDNSCKLVHKEFIWTGDSDLLIALVKSVEDRLNVEADTKNGMVRVLILVEDSPVYRSCFLPLIYKVVVNQTLSLLEESLTEEHRLLKMRARPKILIAENYEQALELFEKFRPYVFGIISDTRFPKDCIMTPDAGIILLSHIKKEIPHLPILLLSSESENRIKAEKIQAVFIDKNAPNLQDQIQDFFLDYLGFGDFIFRLQDKTEIGRASNLRTLEKILPFIPDEPIEYHAKRNRFSNWLMARSEIALASEFAKFEISDFDSTENLRNYIISGIHKLRRSRQKGVVVRFDINDFDPLISDFLKIGKGSLGGKARGLAFISRLLHQSPEIRGQFPDINIVIPKTLVITTEGFKSFVKENQLNFLYHHPEPDHDIEQRFLKADIPEWLYKEIEAFLKKVKGPLSIRSSSLLEDAQFQSYSGLYKTYMIPNNHQDFFVRLHNLITAIKLVFASTYFEKPRLFAQKISYQFREDSMAVIIQQVAGKEYGDFYYPAISGTAQSRNFYPVAHMKPGQGIARIALGFGAILEEGETALRFSPPYPNFMPQFSTVDDILANSQRFFYALRIHNFKKSFNLLHTNNLEKREIIDAQEEFPLKNLCSTYIPDEHRIRDNAYIPGPKILTFAQVLKYNTFPLARVLSVLLDLSTKGLGSPAEIEFAVNLSDDKKHKHTLFFLQLRPMSAEQGHQDLEISSKDIEQAFCFSTHSLGHGRKQDMTDIVYVKPDDFDSGFTKQIAHEIGKINIELYKKDRPYLLIGPGRWGSSDPWLGIPVKWEDISKVGAVIEVRDNQLRADPSQGSHFFQKITSLGIHYITLNQDSSDFFDWDLINSMSFIQETQFLRHLRLEKPFILKNDGKTSRCVILMQ